MLANGPRVQDGYLAVDIIAKDTGLNNETVGRRLRSLGLRTENRTGGRAFLLWDWPKIERVAASYGVFG